MKLDPPASGYMVVTLPLSPAERESLKAARLKYEEAVDAAREKLDFVCDAAWAEYCRAVAAAGTEYGDAGKTSWTQYDKARSAAWAEHERVAAAALAECVNSVNGIPLVAWMLETFHERRIKCGEVVGLLIDGASMSAIDAHARRNLWCRAWDRALAAAFERFDIRDA